VVIYKTQVDRIWAVKGIELPGLDGIAAGNGWRSQDSSKRAAPTGSRVDFLSYGPGFVSGPCG